MRILLFGGAFDPPHVGHLQVARSVILSNVADQIWFVPCSQHPFGKPMTDTTHRLSMVTLAVESCRKELASLADRFVVETYETEQAEPSFTINTLEHFATARPNDTFAWLIGSDQLPKFSQWHRCQDLLRQFQVYVYPRAGYPLAPLLDNMTALSEAPTITVASTTVRERVRKGLAIDDYLPARVAEYIRQHQLYSTNTKNI